MTAIVCVSRSWGIGRDGALLFTSLPTHKRFRTLTVGKDRHPRPQDPRPSPAASPQDRRKYRPLHRDLDDPARKSPTRSMQPCCARAAHDAIATAAPSTALLLPLHRVHVTKVDADPTPQ